jgi:serine protease inhibitor
MKRLVLALLLLAGLSALSTAGPASKFQRYTLAKDNTRFALKLYEQVCKHPGNLFFSPFSISTALGMTCAGARGQTAREMNKVLHYSLDDADVHSAFAGLHKEINETGADSKGSCRMTSANALWGQKGYGYLPEFIKLTRENYGSVLQELDFRTAPSDARKSINSWAEKHTEKTIRDLVPEGVLTPNTRLVLTSAIYFKGPWARPFFKDKTKDDAFHVSNTNDVKAAFMRRTDKYGYYSDATFQMLEMPYIGEDLTMVILLPREIEGIAVFEKTLNVDSLADWFTRMRTLEVQVAIPKFKTTRAMNLKKELTVLGLGQIFGDEADFSGMNSGKEPLHVDDVVHKAFIEVNEAGTEAGAGTGVAISARGGTQTAKTAPIFDADHPFLFMIRDTRSDSILFLGRMVNPQ